MRTSEMREIPDSEMLAWLLKTLVEYDGLELRQEGVDGVWAVYVGQVWHLRRGAGKTPRAAVEDAIRREHGRNGKEESDE